MTLPPAPHQYNQQNEQAMRNALDQILQQIVRADVAFTRLSAVDQVTGEVRYVTIQSGAWVIT